MKLHVDLKERGYDIVMERGVLHRLAQEVDLSRKGTVSALCRQDRSFR